MLNIILGGSYSTVWLMMDLMCFNLWTSVQLLGLNLNEQFLFLE